MGGTYNSRERRNISCNNIKSNKERICQWKEISVVILKDYKSKNDGKVSHMKEKQLRQQNNKGNSNKKKR